MAHVNVSGFEFRLYCLPVINLNLFSLSPPLPPTSRILLAYLIRSGENNGTETFFLLLLLLIFFHAEKAGLIR